MKNKTIKILTKIDDVGKRLDILLNENINELTRSNIKNVIKSKQVKVNNKIVTSQSTKIKEGNIVELNYEKKTDEKIFPSNKKVEIIYEDSDIIVVNKPQGLVVHPGAGNKKDTLVNILVGKYKNKLSNINGQLRPGIVHRLDKDTSGVIVIAKNNFSHSELGKQFSDHTIKRKYYALIWGSLRPLKGKINTLIARSKKNRQLMTVDEFRGKKAITNYKTISTFEKKDIPKVSFVEFTLETGRTHQIRTHMVFMGTSILGDQKYKKRNLKFKKLDKKFFNLLDNLNGQALHAFHLSFVHPTSLNHIKFETELPIKFKKLVNFLKK
jgi:23S rRNA pseudouridine1911/1915/1917 synthase|tara:strand:- start:1138 stop:2112 length:975 start_codon:yes stop_codon:yes gene_type:complete